MARRSYKGKPGVKSTDLNFMVVRGTGRVRRFKVSSRLLTFAFLFFVAYVIISLVAVNQYLQLRVKYNGQTRKIQDLKTELISLKTQVYEAQQQLALLKRKPSPETATMELVKKVVPQRANIEETLPFPEEAKGIESQSLPQQAAQIPQPPLEPKEFVEVRDLKVKISSASLNVAFKVYKASDSAGPVRGYVHIIWIEEPSEPSKAWSYPNVILADGMPKDYKTGQLFSIRRFRKIRASFEKKANKDIPRVLRIVAYNSKGEVVFSKDYDMAQFIKGKPAQLRPPPSGKEKTSPAEKSKPRSPSESTKALLSG